LASVPSTMAVFIPLVQMGINFSAALLRQPLETAPV